MALIDRISRLLTADMHAVLDRIEEPDVLLRHAIREMEEELVRSEQHAKRLDFERARLVDRHRKIEVVLVELDEQLGIALDSGNEELARKVVKRTLQNERLSKHVEERRAATEKSLVDRERTLAEQREHLDVLRQKAELFAEKVHSEVDPSIDDELAVRDEEVELALVRERQKRTRS